MGKLNIEKLCLKGACIIHPNKYEDDRGSFSRVFCKEEMSKITNENFVQVNHSITTKKGTIRGMHFQYAPDAEVKMVKCIKGSILDVIVDIRENSPTLLKHHSEILSADNMKMIYIPKGFAHGFQTLEDNTELLYFHSNFYTQKNEGALNISDPLLNIQWPLDKIKLSSKDKEHNLVNVDFKGIKIEL
jgi:dTDP-4-dehydrorhamnose 3,5-epimerase